MEPVAWAEILRLDELSTARWADLTIVLVKWAFEAGRQVGREEG